MDPTARIISPAANKRLVHRGSAVRVADDACRWMVGMDVIVYYSHTRDGVDPGHLNGGGEADDELYLTRGYKGRIRAVSAVHVQRCIGRDQDWDVMVSADVEYSDGSVETEELKASDMLLGGSKQKDNVPEDAWMVDSKDRNMQLLAMALMKASALQAMERASGSGSTADVSGSTSSVPSRKKAVSGGGVAARLAFAVMQSVLLIAMVVTFAACATSPPQNRHALDMARNVLDVACDGARRALAGLCERMATYATAGVSVVEGNPEE